VAFVRQTQMGAGADEVRAYRQPQDRQGARSRRAALTAWTRRQGDRIEMPFAAAHESVHVKVFGCRPMMTAPRTRGPASANLQGRKPRVVGQYGASDAMGISARGPLPACVDRLFGKRSMGWRNRSTDRDRHNRRCAAQIDRQGGCPGRRAGEHGHGRSRGGEAEVQYWSLRRTDCDHDVSILITAVGSAGR
jgi:hypothetical protein